jgi:AcrR family transcriptional regulator
LFSDRSFDGATTREIAARADNLALAIQRGLREGLCGF